MATGGWLSTAIRTLKSYGSIISPLPLVTFMFTLFAVLDAVFMSRICVGMGLQIFI
jgi:hypothetical protein